MEILIGIGIFIALVLFIEGVYFALRSGRRPEKAKIKKRLRTLASGAHKSEEIDILRKRLLSEMTWFNRILSSIPSMQNLQRLLEQANAKYSLGTYIWTTVMFVSCGFILGSLVHINLISRTVIALIFGSIPFLLLISKKNKRMLKFERQLPDALDLMVRALKAGHAFSGGLKMIADEFEDPIGPEFEKTMDEVNFGVNVPDALKNLAERVDCPDLSFFVISVILQRETGGNLAEILDKISFLIRERFRLQGKIRVLSAEGKLSAIVLVAIPFLITLYMSIANPKFITPLLTDPIGHYMIALAVTMMIIGIFVMKKMVSFKV